MASTHFTTGTTITSEWLNDVNDAVYEGNITADGVQYTPPFTGGVTETVEAKLAQTVSVKDFGAVGDGVTDDTVAIQAAIVYAEASEVAGSSGQPVGIVFPAGVYKVTSSLTFTRSIQVNGIGWPEIKAFHNGDVIRLIGIPSASLFPRNQQVFSSLRFTTNSGNTPTSIIRIGTNSGAYPSYVNADPDVRIINCVFDLITANYVIDNNRGFGLTISNCMFTVITATAVLKLRQSANEIPYWSYATNIYGCDFSNVTGKAIEADGGDLTVFGGIIEGCSNGAVQTGVNTGYVGSQPVSFYGTYFEANTIYHYTSLNTRVHTLFSGCKFVKGTASDNDIILSDSSQNTFINCSSPNQAPTILGGNVSFNNCNYMQNNVVTVNSFTTNRNTQHTTTPTTAVVFNGASGYGPQISLSPGAGGGGAILLCSHSGYPLAAYSVTEVFMLVFTLGGGVTAVSMGRHENGDTSTFSFGSSGGYLTVTASQPGFANYTLVSKSAYPSFLPG